MAEVEKTAEIEVTPEMIEAGATVLEEFSRFHDGRVLASMVYTAMRLAQG
tara:strand:+ start:102140 stop:102289 length:150 start_codon:yes stop_codon:yes gene_type:complete